MPMDFIMGLPKLEGRDVIFVVMDRLTKYAHFFGIQNAYIASQVVEVIMKKIHRLHGFLKIIVSDSDPKLT